MGNDGDRHLTVGGGCREAGGGGLDDPWELGQNGGIRVDLCFSSGADAWIKTDGHMQTIYRYVHKTDQHSCKAWVEQW